MRLLFNVQVLPAEWEALVIFFFQSACWLNVRCIDWCVCSCYLSVFLSVGLIYWSSLRQGEMSLREAVSFFCFCF